MRKREVRKKKSTQKKLREPARVAHSSASGEEPAPVRSSSVTACLTSVPELAQQSDDVMTDPTLGWAARKITVSGYDCALSPSP